MQGKKILVKTCTLDDFLAERNIEDVDLIKIDVEGAELLVLEGAKNTLKSSKTIKLLVDIDVEEDEDREVLFNTLQSYGFKLYKIGKTLSRIERLDSSIKDIYAVKDRTS